MDRIFSAGALILAVAACVVAFVMSYRRADEMVALKDQVTTLQRQMSDTQSVVKDLQQRIAPILVAFESATSQPQLDMSKLTDEANTAFLAEFEKKDGVKKTPSGLLYRQVKPPKDGGAAPKQGGSVTVAYKGQFIDGTVFDATDMHGGPMTFPLQGLIQAWMEALPMMKEGEVWELVVPYQLGYGAEGRGGIPPKQTLIFQIELIKVEPAKADNAPQ